MKNSQDKLTVFANWIKTNRLNIVELHKAFETDTNSKIDLAIFCAKMFKQTKHYRNSIP